MEHLRLKQQHGFGTTDDGLLPYDATKLPMQAGASIYADDHDAEEDEDRDIVGSDLKLDHDYAPHKLFTATLRKSTALPTFVRFLQGLLAIGIIAAIACLIGSTNFTIADLFASALAFLATGWCILCLAITWKRVVKTLGLWDSVREISWMYDAGMGAIIFAPIVLFSWFPFVSTFQSRILFNQAFSRGLEISLILAGNKANQES